MSSVNENKDTPTALPTTNDTPPSDGKASGLQRVLPLQDHLLSFFQFW